MEGPSRGVGGARSLGVRAAVALRAVVIHGDTGESATTADTATTVRRTRRRRRRAGWPRRARARGCLARAPFDHAAQLRRGAHAAERAAARFCDADTPAGRAHVG